MKKRILASFLSLVLVLSLVPASALAVEGSSEVPAEPTVVEPVEPSEVPAVPPVEEQEEPEIPACAGLEGCDGDTHAEGCPLYVEPEEAPAEDEIDTNEYYELDEVKDENSLAVPAADAMSGTFGKELGHYDKTLSVASFEELQNGLTGTEYLEKTILVNVTEDIEQPSEITLTGKRTILLQSSGDKTHTIKAADSFSNTSMFSFSEDSGSHIICTLENIIIDANHKTRGFALTSEANGTDQHCLILGNGSVIQNAYSTQSTAGGVQLTSSNLFINGGTIQNCTSTKSTGSGGAVLAWNKHSNKRCSIVMNDGLITGCSGTYGAVVAPWGADITLRGGTITKNYRYGTAVNFAGGVFFGASTGLSIGGNIEVFDNYGLNKNEPTETENSERDIYLNNHPVEITLENGFSGKFNLAFTTYNKLYEQVSIQTEDKIGVDVLERIGVQAYGTTDSTSVTAYFADKHVIKFAPENLIVTVTFNANTGDASETAEQQATTGTTAKLHANPFTREGYTFSGWSTTKDSGGETYADQADFKFERSTTLYAQWIELKHDDITMEYGSTQAFPTIEGVALTDWTSDNEKVVQIVDGKLKAVGLGTANITANAALAPRSGETLTVSVEVIPKKITVSMENATVNYDEQPHTIEAKPAEGGTLPTDLELVYSYKESNASDDEYIHVAPTHPGTYTVKVESGNSNYTLTGKTSATLTISEPQQAQDVSDQVAVTDPSLVYDATAKVHTAAYEGITDWRIVYYDTEGKKLDSAPVNAGNYWVTINGESENKAVYASITMPFTVTPAPLTVKAVDKTIRVGDQLPEYTYTVSGWQGSDTDDLLSGVTVSCPTADASKAGAHTIAVSGPDVIDNYEITYVGGTLTVSHRSSGGSSSGSSSGDHTVSVEAGKHGSVTVSPKRADKGDTVTITVKPDKGYELDELTVTDKSGDTVKIKGKGNGKFTFTMPGSKVTVESSFKQLSAEVDVPAFADVPTDAYYADAVAWAVKEGITSGTTAATFTPNASCTRAQMVTFLWRANGSPVVDHAMSFTDMPADAYYAEAVRWAVSEGITTGTTATTFSPNATVTRAQAVTFIYRNVRAQGGGFTGNWMFPCPFTDVPADANYFESVQWCAMKDITSGTSADTFSPDAPCTRAQIVAFLYRDAQ